MCLMFHIRIVHFFGMLKKEKSIYTKCLCLLSEISPPGLPNLGAQIRCVQNQCNTVQMDPKYSLETNTKQRCIKNKRLSDYICSVATISWKVCLMSKKTGQVLNYIKLYGKIIYLTCIRIRAVFEFAQTLGA